MNQQSLRNSMRIYHRYLGFFLVGIMIVYSMSGIVLIFRDTDFLKNEKTEEKTLHPNLTADQLGKEIRIRNLAFDGQTNDTMRFKQGWYNVTSGDVHYTVKSLPLALEKMTKMHKATSKDPLFFMNIFFGASLFFFAISSLWMFAPQMEPFKKGMYFTVAGILLTFLMLLT